MLSAVVMSHAGLRFSLYAALSILVMVWGECSGCTVSVNHSN